MEAPQPLPVQVLKAVQEFSATPHPPWHDLLLTLVRCTGAEMGQITLHYPDHVPLALVGLDKPIYPPDLPPGIARVLDLDMGDDARWAVSLFFAGDASLSPPQLTALNVIQPFLRLTLRNELFRLETEQFARGLAHDLRGGIGRATTFAEMLSTHDLDAPASALAIAASNSLMPLSRLLTDAAVFASAGKPVETTVVSLDSVFADLCYLKRREIEARDADVTFEGGHFRHQLPLEELVNVLCRLLDNSLKFVHGKPVIHISAAKPECGLNIAVQDNGPGLDGQYSSTLFVPFRRLQGSSVPGFGLGLSICRRRIESAGGRIWAAAAPSGTLIRIWLP